MTENKQVEDRQQKGSSFSKLSIGVKISIALVFLIIVGVAFYMLQPKEQKQASTEELGKQAFTMTEVAVNEKLNNADNVKFHGDFKYWSMPDSTIIVKGVLDNQTDTGLIAHKYFAQWKYKGGDYTEKNNWNLLELNIGKQ
jgi:hypothetical protein